MITRRSFLKNTAYSTTALSLGGLTACTNNSSTQTTTKMPAPKSIPPLKISLAQWSLNRAFFANELDAKDFAKIAKNDYDISLIASSKKYRIPYGICRFNEKNFEKFDEKPELNFSL